MANLFAAFQMAGVKPRGWGHHAPCEIRCQKFFILASINLYKLDCILKLNTSNAGLEQSEHFKFLLYRTPHDNWSKAAENNARCLKLIITRSISILWMNIEQLCEIDLCRITWASTFLVSALFQEKLKSWRIQRTCVTIFTRKGFCLMSVCSRWNKIIWEF